MSDMERRSMPLFSMGIVMELTGLSARQIRYYEQHYLVKPSRTQGNRRLFSFRDVDRLLEIKDLIEKGVNLAGIKQLLKMDNDITPVVKEEDSSLSKEITNRELREMLRKELFNAGRLNNVSLIQGELSRFFH